MELNQWERQMLRDLVRAEQAKRSRFELPPNMKTELMRRFDNLLDKIEDAGPD